MATYNHFTKSSDPNIKSAAQEYKGGRGNVAGNQFRKRLILSVVLLLKGDPIAAWREWFRPRLPLRRVTTGVGNHIFLPLFFCRIRYVDSDI